MSFASAAFERLNRKLAEADTDDSVNFVYEQMCSKLRSIELNGHMSRLIEIEHKEPIGLLEYLAERKERFHYVGNDDYVHTFAVTPKQDISYESTYINKEKPLRYLYGRFKKCLDEGSSIDSLQKKYADALDPYLRLHLQMDMSDSVCSFAAMYGLLDTLKWLRDNGCPWSEWTCAFAASNGHIEVLIWAHNHGCPCNGACRKCVIECNGTFMTRQQRKIAIATFKLRAYAKTASRLLSVFNDFMEMRYAPPGVFMEDGGAGYADGLCRWENKLNFFFTGHLGRKDQLYPEI